MSVLGKIFGLGTSEQEKIDELVASAQERPLQVVRNCVKASGLDIINGSEKKSGDTALHVACRWNRPEVVSYLKERGANVNVVNTKRKNQTPLHECAQHGSAEALDALLSGEGQKLDINAVNEDDQTALHLAVDSQKINVIRKLLEQRCHVETKEKKWGRTAAHIAARKDYIEILKLLREKGRCNLMSPDKRGFNVFHTAASSGSMKCLLWMMERQVLVDPTVKTQPPESGASVDTPVYAHDLAKDKHAEAHRAVLDYFSRYNVWEDQLQEGCDVPSTVKLYLCGSPRVGKTKLLESMQRSYLASFFEGREERNTEWERTKGVNIESIFGGKISAWDFAGQMEDYVTHEFFLTTSNTLFLVLLRLDSPVQEQKAQLIRWLRFIKTCNQGNQGLHPVRRTTKNAAAVATEQGLELLQAPVIIVCTHNDHFHGENGEVPRREVERLLNDQREIFKDYLEISEKVFFMDGRRSQDKPMTDLKDFILARREQLLREQVKIPKLCEAISKKLQEDRWCCNGAKSLVPFEDYQTYVHCRVNPLVDETMLRGVTKCLMSSANMVYFDMRELRHWLVLDPVWLCRDVLGTILMPQTFETKKITTGPHGVVMREDLKLLFPQANFDALMELITHFDLCYSLNDQNVQLPSTITNRQPNKSIWPASASFTDRELVSIGRRLRCIDHTDLFSPGFFPRLQVSVRRFFRPSDDNLCLWRGGLYFKHYVGEDRENETLIELNEERRLDVCCRGRKERALTLMDHLETVLLCCKKTLEAACPRLRLTVSILSVAHLAQVRAGSRDRLEYSAATLCQCERIGKWDVQVAGANHPEKVMDLLYAGVEQLSLRKVGIKAHIMHLPTELLEYLNDRLSQPHEFKRDWRLLAQHLALGDQIELFNVFPDRRAYRVLEKFAENPKATIKSLISLIRDKVGRVDVARELEAQVQRMLKTMRETDALAAAPQT